MTLRRVFLMGAMAAAFAFFGTGTAQADNCRERIQREEFKLQRDIRNHGFYSRHAQRQREKIYRLRQQCGESFWGNNGRWDRDHDRDNRWRRDRDRDHDRDDRRSWRNRDRDRDHDRDRDRNRNNWYWDGHRWRRR